MEFGHVSVVSYVALLVVAGLCHVSRTTGLTQLFATCSLILSFCCFVHRAAGGFQEKGPNHAGSLNPRLRKGIMLLLLHSLGQSNHKVAEFQGLGNRLHPFMEGATKSHGKEGGYRKTADWVHQCSQNSHNHH